MKYLILMFFCLAGCAQVHHGNCVPRAFFNATTWAITTKMPVEIIDMRGHWQAKEVDGPYLCGSGWSVWECQSEGVPRETLTLDQAMKHFMNSNPWSKK